MSMLLTLLYTCLSFCRSLRIELAVYGSCFLLRTLVCLIITRVSVALFFRFSQNVMLFLCLTHREIASGQIIESK
jgi:hypothetical protein